MNNLTIIIIIIIIIIKKIKMKIKNKWYLNVMKLKQLTR
jgi:hypothetical protein